MLKIIQSELHEYLTPFEELRVKLRKCDTIFDFFKKIQISGGHISEKKNLLISIFVVVKYTHCHML